MPPLQGQSIGSCFILRQQVCLQGCSKHSGHCFPSGPGCVGCVPLPCDHDHFLLYPELPLETSCTILTQPDPDFIYLVSADEGLYNCPIWHHFSSKEFTSVPMEEGMLAVYAEKKKRGILCWRYLIECLSVFYSTCRMSQTWEFPHSFIVTLHCLIFMCFRMKINPKKWYS